MAELKKIRVREARPRDVGLFRSLWSQFLREQQEAGSIIRGDSEKNLEIFTNVFKTYVDKEASEYDQHNGIALFIGEVAVLLVGASGNSVEMTIGRRPARVWGIYVIPDQRDKGIEVKLYEEAFKRLREMGFDAVFGNNALESVLGHITCSSEHLVYVELKDNNMKDDK